MKNEAARYNLAIACGTPERRDEIRNRLRRLAAYLCEATGSKIVQSDVLVRALVQYEKIVRPKGRIIRRVRSGEKRCWHTAPGCRAFSGTRCRLRNPAHEIHSAWFATRGEKITITWKTGDDTYKLQCELREKRT